jgi:hypothetical protein
MDGLRASIILLIILLVIGAVIGIIAHRVITPGNGSETFVEGLSERKDGLITVEGRYIQAVSPVYYPNPQILGLMLGGTDTEMAELLDCIWFKESSRGQNMFGDYRNGKPMAFGHFQIWLKYHPVSYDCAMDFECSAEFTEQKIREGQGYLWTTYKGCL